MSDSDDEFSEFPPWRGGPSEVCGQSNELRRCIDELRSKAVRPSDDPRSSDNPRRSSNGPRRSSDDLRRSNDDPRRSSGYAGHLLVKEMTEHVNQHFYWSGMK